VILEEVALEAVDEDGRLVARTSARQLAERLGVDPSTAGKALGALRRHGLLLLEREHGAAGRFGLSVYVLGAVAGLRVVHPGSIARWVAPPSLEKASTADSAVAALTPSGPRVEGPRVVEPGMAQPHMETSRPGDAEAARPTRAKTPAGPAPASAAAPQCPGQTALNFGTVSS
jgi:hypothetical protein